MNLGELGAFLEARRGGLRPDGFDLPATGHRRVPGLRRDEVAGLAGLSTDYYKRLEQGRAVPSEQVLEALAGAMRLTGDERLHLYHLAGRTAPPRPTTGTAPAQMLDLLDQLGSTPAMVLTDLYEYVAHNRGARSLLGAARFRPSPQQGMAFQWFTRPEEGRSHWSETDHHRQSRQFVADLRATLARRSYDQEVVGFIAQLRNRSPEFARLWERRDVLVLGGGATLLDHPEVGRLRVDTKCLMSPDLAFRLVWFVPTDARSAAAMADLDRAAPVPAASR